MARARLLQPRHEREQVAAVDGQRARPADPGARRDQPDPVAVAAFLAQEALEHVAGVDGAGRGEMDVVDDYEEERAPGPGGAQVRDDRLGSGRVRRRGGGRAWAPPG